MDALAKRQEASQHELDTKLKKLKKDVTATQEDVTEYVLRRTKRDLPPELKMKGHREQFKFNSEVEDRLNTSNANKKIVQEAINELQEGMDAISER